MPDLNVKIGPDYFQAAATSLFSGKSIRLGIIPNGSEISVDTIETAPNTVIAAEFNGSGWTRPTITLPGIGSYNATTDRWNFPSLSFEITGPTGGISIKQIFLLVGGVATPRDTTRDFLFGLSTALTTPITVAASATQPITVPTFFLNSAT